jgi:hypothetical protein
MEVVGVTKTGKYMWIAETPKPFLYLPFAQQERTRMTLLVETMNANARDEAGLGLSARGSATAGLVGQGRDGELLRGLIEDQFEAADVAAIDLLPLWRVANVTNFRLARRALPRHRPGILSRTEYAGKGRKRSPSFPRVVLHDLLAC